MSVGRRVDLDSRDGWLGKARVEAAAAAINGAPLYVMVEFAVYKSHRINVYYV